MWCGMLLVAFGREGKHGVGGIRSFCVGVEVVIILGGQSYTNLEFQHSFTI